MYIEYPEYRINILKIYEDYKKYTSEAANATGLFYCILKYYDDSKLIIKNSVFLLTSLL